MQDYNNREQHRSEIVAQMAQLIESVKTKKAESRQTDAIEDWFELGLAYGKLLAHQRLDILLGTGQKPVDKIQDDIEYMQNWLKTNYLEHCTGVAVERANQLLNN